MMNAFHLGKLCAIVPLDLDKVNYILTQVAQFSERATFSIGRLGVIFANETENYIILVSIVCATFSYPFQPTFQKSHVKTALATSLLCSPVQ